MNRKRKVTIAGCVIALGVFFLYPWKQVIVVPAIRILILDEAGNPAGAVVVKEEWEYRCIGSSGHKEVARADSSGYASFPERTEKISMLRLSLSFAREMLYLPHGYDFGSYVSVWAFGKDPYVWYYVPFSWYEHFPDRMQLKRSESPEVP